MRADFHLLLRDERLVMACLSAASAIALPTTTSLLGRLRAVIASCNSALTLASFFALSSSDMRFVDAGIGGRGALSWEATESAFGMFVIDMGSLASRFNIGVEADLINAMTPLGPRDILRRCFSDSLDKTLSNVLDFDDPGRFATEIGFGFGFIVESVFSCFFCFGFDGGNMIGPPNLRLIESVFSGNLAEKLEKKLAISPWAFEPGNLTMVQ